MALLETGRVVPDAWTFVPDGEPVPADGAVIVTLARLTVEVDTLSGRALGVRLASHEPAAAVAPFLDDVQLIAVEFPKFRDGRGFSTARELRERYRFGGEIRAVGHTLPDQYRFLLRCGFSTVEVPDGAVVESWARALTEITVAYQRAVDDATPAGLLRRRFAPIEQGARTAPSPPRGEGWGEGVATPSPEPTGDAETPPHPASPRGGEGAQRRKLHMPGETSNARRAAE